MATVEAKAKVLNRHRNAIAHYRKWLKASKKATRRERIDMFDFLVDHAQDLGDS